MVGKLVEVFLNKMLVWRNWQHAQDLKSCGPKGPCRFDPDHEHYDKEEIHLFGRHQDSSRYRELGCCEILR